MIINVPTHSDRISIRFSRVNQMSDFNRLFYRGFAAHDHVDAEDETDLGAWSVSQAFKSSACPCCKHLFVEYKNYPKNKGQFINDVQHISSVSILCLCHVCGWWQIRQEFDMLIEGRPVIANWAYQYSSTLETIDITKNDVLVNDLRKHLMTRWDDRKLISAGKAEELVRSILKDHLRCDVFSATANTNAPDGGVDLHVCSKSGDIIAAVQVKRRITRNVEPVDKVRDFVGALVVNNLKKGIYVTTADSFSGPAKEISTSTGLRNHKLELQLVDGHKLFEILKATTAPASLKLPQGLKDDTVWCDIKGQEYKSTELLLTNITLT